MRQGLLAGIEGCHLEYFPHFQHLTHAAGSPTCSSLVTPIAALELPTIPPDTRHRCCLHLPCLLAPACQLVSRDLFLKLRAQAEQRRIGGWNKIVWQLENEEELHDPKAKNVKLVEARCGRCLTARLCLHCHCRAVLLLVHANWKGRCGSG